MRTIFDLIKISFLLGCVFVVGTCFYSVWNVANKIEADKKFEESYVLDLTIVKGWSWEKEDNYSYVRGRVRNDGSRTLRYWSVASQYLSKGGEVLDQDYTNSVQPLRPGDSQSFQIMHRDDPAYKKVQVFVQEVRLQ